MIRKKVEGGELVIDPAGASVIETKHAIVVEVPVQYRRKDGVIDVGSVYIGTEPLSVVEREAHIWAAGRARSAHFEANVPSLLDKQAKG